MALTAEQVQSFERNGFTLIDTPLSELELDAAEDGWGRVQRGETEIWSDPDYLATLAHPFFESVAKQVLRADAAAIIETHIHERPPTAPGEPVGGGDRSWKGGHLDVQLTRSDWDATPRRDQISIWLWCNGVPENRGAMRVLPGSVSTASRENGIGCCRTCTSAHISVVRPTLSAELLCVSILSCAALDHR